MDTHIIKLEKLIKEQAQVIEKLKKGMVLLERKIITVSKRADSAYHTGQRNSRDIEDLGRSIKGK